MNLSSISNRLRDRAAALRLDAKAASAEADSCSDDQMYNAARRREEAYKMCADELLMLADEFADWSV